MGLRRDQNEIRKKRDVGTAEGDGQVIVHKASVGIRGCIVGLLEFVLAVWGRWMIGRVSFGDVGFWIVGLFSFLSNSHARANLGVDFVFPW